MAAKAAVPGVAFPCAHRFRGHGPLLQFITHGVVVGAALGRLSGLTARGGLAAGRTNKGRAPCISPDGGSPMSEWTVPL